MEVLERSVLRTVISTSIDGGRQSAEILRDGASTTLAETTTLFATQIHTRGASPGKQVYAIGTELNASRISAGHGGIITATATAVHLGRSSAIYTVEIHGEADRPISIARMADHILVCSSHN